MEKDSAAAGQSVVTQKVDTPWKAIAIVLALILIAVLTYTALVVTGAMELGLSLL